MLRGGVNDLGGTLMEETISRMAGSANGSYKTISQLTGAGRADRAAAAAAHDDLRPAVRGADRLRPPPATASAPPSAAPRAPLPLVEA